MVQGQPRQRVAAREKAARERAGQEEARQWQDPFTSLERWFYRLPNREMAEQCHCGSGKPVLYWSPEDGSGCEDCRGSLSVYIPTAVMSNIMDKFGISDDVKAQVYAQMRAASPRKQDTRPEHVRAYEDRPGPMQGRRGMYAHLDP